MSKICCRSNLSESEQTGWGCSAKMNTRIALIIKKSIKNIDPNAFLTVNESTEVLGKGFTEY